MRGAGVLYESPYLSLHQVLTLKKGCLYVRGAMECEVRMLSNLARLVVILSFGKSTVTSACLIGNQEGNNGCVAS